jgi:hypothetical protein
MKCYFGFVQKHEISNYTYARTHARTVWTWFHLPAEGVVENDY